MDVIYITRLCVYVHIVQDDPDLRSSPRAHGRGGGEDQAVWEGGGGPAQAPAPLSDALQQVHPHLPPPLWAPVQAHLLRLQQAAGSLRGHPRRAHGEFGRGVCVAFCQVVV